MTSTIKILLVDDHPLVRDGLRARLEAMPQFEVVAEAGGAAEALEQAAQCTIDLVLMDINMRGANGIEATAQFKQAFPRIAVLILSMHDKLEYVSQAIQAGAHQGVVVDQQDFDCRGHGVLLPGTLMIHISRCRGFVQLLLAA